MSKLKPFEMLQHCAIKLALARLDAQTAGTNYDRNRLVYQYFVVKKLMPSKDARNMINIITRDIKYAAYAFDQYFQLYLGYKPGPDCNPVGEKIQQGLLDQYGVNLPKELKYGNAPTV